MAMIKKKSKSYRHRGLLDGCSNGVDRLRLESDRPRFATECLSRALASAPVDGAANDELIEVLARALQVPKRAVSIVAGDRSRQKRARVSGH
jgi:uncharacterized protein YggU (UPF0235/DUF167 family)